MIDCENCIIKDARMTDMQRCQVSCLDLEDALREHDKQIRADAFDDVMRLCDAYCHFDKSKHPSNGYVISRASLLDIVGKLKEQSPKT